MMKPGFADLIVTIQRQLRISLKPHKLLSFRAPVIKLELEPLSARRIKEMQNRREVGKRCFKRVEREGEREKPLLEKDGEKPEGNEKGSVKEKQRRKKRDDDAENMPVPLNLANVKSKGEELQLQSRTNPPSPQCFSANRAPAKTSTPSKASRLTVRGMLEESKDEEEIEGKVRSFFAADGRESRALDVFWFLKPCTHSS
ncbi:interferon-activable protein [Salix suchowensis]|nr:interferon-activable protein [Salix suchowensis]